MRNKHTFIVPVILFILLACFSGCTKSSPQSSENKPAQSVSPTVEIPSLEPSTVTSNVTVQPTIDSQTGAPDIYSPSESPVVPFVINEMTDSEEGTFYIGQSHEDVNIVLEERDIFIINDIDVSIETEELGIAFDDENRLISLQLTSASKTPTSMGLQFGDSYERMIELYGTGYSEEILSSDASLYEYIIGSHYFHVRIYNGGVNLWGISVESILGYN